METVNAAYLKRIGKIQTIAQMHIRCSDVRKVLATRATVAVRVSETLNGEVRLAGRETLDIVVLTESGVTRESGWTDFTDRAECEGVMPTTKATATARVLDTDIVSVNDGEVTLASVIEITVEAEECAVLPTQPLQVGGVYTGDTRLTLSGLVTRLNGKAEVRSEEKADIDKLIFAEARACIKGAEAGIDCVTVTGEVYIDGIGLAGDELRSFSLTLPLTEEIEAEGARRGDSVHARVLSTAVSAEESESGVTLSATVEIGGAVFSELAVSCATDAFSPDCEIEVTKTPISGVIVREIKYVEEQVEGTVTLPDGENADRVLATCDFRISAMEAYPDGGKAVLEGVIGGNIIYADAEAGKKSSCAVELPFRITTAEAASDGDIIEATGCVSRISVRPSRLGELNVRCGLSLCLRITSETHAEIITDVKCGEKYPPRCGVISMHVAAEGETLMESARALRISPDEVLSQNPELEYPLKKGTKVFAFGSK